MTDDNVVVCARTSPWRTAAVAVAAGLALAGCSPGGGGSARPDTSVPHTSAPGTSGARSGSPAASASASVAGNDGAPPTPLRPDPAKVPRTKSRAEALARTVALEPQDWGAQFRAQQPATSPPHTVAELDGQCRWQRRELPAGVLASLSRYSEIPATGAKGAVEVSAAVTVHTSVREADERIAATLEEPLRCREQQVRSDERITELISTATPYGQGNNTYADDQVVETGAYLTGNGKQTYYWFVTRLHTLTLAVSVKGAAGYPDSELGTFASRANVTMLNRVQFELGGQNR
ncbi:hypothetical protein ACIQPQ_37090 [Streptomyces sp. NPDC091281]|uniref:hypothetical protein n=1 Tax=Streptomyces sp. NPDC091281 TaxID=3365985 RepID=UPI0037F9D8CB